MTSDDMLKDCAAPHSAAPAGVLRVLRLPLPEQDDHSRHGNRLALLAGCHLLLCHLRVHHGGDQVWGRQAAAELPTGENATPGCLQDRRQSGQIGMQQM